MRHVPEQNPFQAKDPFPGASATVRRALTQMNHDAPYVHHTIDACKALKLKTECPAWRGEATAHLAIPSKKVAIYFRHFGDRQRIDAMKERWKAQGWEMFAVAPGQVEGIPAANLVKHLGDALKELGK